MRRVALLALAVLAGCASRSPAPVNVRLGEDACAHCRMTVVSIKTAAQVVSPEDEPLIFDDLGCLRDYLARRPLAPGHRVFVADHRTGAWVDLAAAVITQSKVTTPMSSGLIAHADAASRDADPDARGGASAKVLP